MTAIKPKKKTGSEQLCLAFILCLFPFLSTTQIGMGNDIATVPFDCPAEFYHVIDSRLTEFDLSTLENKPIGPDYINVYRNVNAIGYNVKDDFLYGMVTRANNNRIFLAKIDAEGKMERIKELTGVSGGFPVGTMDLDDNLYIYTNFSGSNANFVVFSDLSTNTNPPVQSIPIRNQMGNAIPGATKPSLTDAVFNITDGRIYAMDNESAQKVFVFTRIANRFELSSIDLDRPIPCMNAGTSFGAQWIDVDGELFVSCNDGGNIYKIDLETGTWEFVISTQISTGNNDGASCPRAQDPFTDEIPTLSQWALLILAMSLSSLSLIVLFKRRKITI